MRATLVGVLVLAVGCGEAEERLVPVRGRVTFQGQPVGEGLVQFNEAATGRGAETALGPDGTYAATLPAGSYVVVVIPPIIDSDPAKGPPNPTFKKVKNIPARYHSAATSGLTAGVSPASTSHDFELKP